MEFLSTEVFWQSAWTVFAFVFFIVVIIWAWSGKRKDNFDTAARMALDDDEALSDEQQRKR
ncbi:MAG: CcoQ/FixQ family Cbb3-type cytochrome c oxidase assembly chaperone [Gammaproteobacteria bacterium]|nr:MAG: CcoQ/FixQ family Cbb3-type cytochrome c oxidase assembly chaperone [Gammaproteobacteria bacterium]